MSLTSVEQSVYTELKGAERNAYETIKGHHRKQAPPCRTSRPGSQKPTCFTMQCTQPTSAANADAYHRILTIDLESPMSISLVG